MKKILLGLGAMALMASSTFADTLGTIETVTFNAATNAALVKVKKDDGTYTNPVKLIGSQDGIKAMLAIALTAKTSGKPVKLRFGNVNGENGWILLSIQ